MIISINKKIFHKIMYLILALLLIININNYVLNKRQIFASNNINDDNNKKYIAFTYDDGPSKYTIEILNILEETNSCATFFVIGNKIEKNSDTILKIYNSNSEIGSHTFSHANLSKINEKQIENELKNTNNIYYDITKDNLKLLRPPYEKYNKNILDYNYKLITWNIDTLDWKYKDKYKIYNNIIKNACDGCIVLMHDTIKETVEATKMAIQTLKKLDYEIVSISNLISIKNYNIDKKEVINSIK